MTKILAVSFLDFDVTEGIVEIMEKYPDAPILIPVTENKKFISSVVDAALEMSRPFQLFFSEVDDFIDDLVLKADDITVCVNPLKEVIREASPEDVLAIVWDDSVEAHMVLHSLEDLAIEAFDITENLTPIEVSLNDSDQLFIEVQENLSQFIESFAEYLTVSVLDRITKTIQAVVEAQEEPTDE